MNGWIGVDLDGTLAHYDGWRGAGHIGEPVPAMVERVKRWLGEGRQVKIFTARVYNDSAPGRFAEAVESQLAIEAWCQKHLGRKLPITCVKDFGMVEFWDDRAVQVVTNTGRRADGVD